MFSRLKYEEPRDECWPKERSGHKMVSVGSDIIMYGGTPFFYMGGPTEPCRKLWKFNVNTGKWKSIKFEGGIELPKCSFHFVMHPVDDFLYIIGPCEDGKVYRMDIETAEVSLVKYTGVRVPCAARRSSAFDAERKVIYFQGGVGNDCTRAVFSFDCVNHVCKRVLRINEILEDFTGHQMLYYNNKIYFMGGSSTNGLLPFSCLVLFDLEKQTWAIEDAKGDPNQEFVKYPQTRYSHSGTFTSERNGKNPRYIISGGAATEGSRNDIWILNLETLTWNRFEKNLPFSTYHHDSAVTACGKFVTFGGIMTYSKNPRFKALPSNLISSVRITPPSLQRCAFNATEKVYPDFKDSVISRNEGPPVHVQDVVNIEEM